MPEPVGAGEIHNDRSLNWMLAVLFLIYVFSWLDRLIVSMLVTPMKHAMELSDFQVSLVLGPSFAVAFAVFSAPLGWASDRFPRRLVIFAGVLVWSMATIGCGLAKSYGVLLTCRVFVGMGEAALLPTAYSMIADGFPPHRVTFATSIFQSAGKIGSAAAFGVGAIVIGFAQHLQSSSESLFGSAQYWQITYFMVGAPGLVIAFLLFTFREPRRNGPMTPQNPGLRPVIDFVAKNSKLCFLLAAASTTNAIFGYALSSWVPTYMERQYAWTTAHYGIGLSILNITGALILLGCGRTVDRLFAKGMRDAHLRFCSWTILVLSPAVLFGFFAGNPYVFLVCYALSQIISAPMIVYTAAIVGQVAPSELRGQLLGGLMFVFNSLGYGGGPAIVGLLTDRVFGNEAALGKSMMTVTAIGIALTYLSARSVLPLVDSAVRKRQDEVSAA